MEDAIRKLCQNEVDPDIIAKRLGVSLAKVQIEYNLVRRERAARENVKSMDWAPREPERGNRIPVKYLRKPQPRRIMTVTQYVCGDPGPMHIEAREARG